MILNLTPAQRSQTHLALLQSFEADHAPGTGRDIAAHCWAELVAFHLDSVTLVSALGAALESRITTLGDVGPVFVDGDQLNSLFDGRGELARLAAGLAGLAPIYHRDLDATFFQPPGTDANAICSLVEVSDL